jgi:hypothetical protein
MSVPKSNLELKRCAAQPAAAAARPSNPPGFPVLSYRVGTRPDFLRRMLDRLPMQAIPDGPNAGAHPLQALSTHDAGDPTVALLDAWATAADVLTFYQERIANEAFLRTAVERRSVLELARLAGYTLSPGVAASAFLAFTVDDSPGAAATVLVPQGTQVKSIPGQNELPQSFETDTDFTARAAWNSLAPRLTRPQDLTTFGELFLAGTATGLSPGDRLLLVASDATGEVVATLVAHLRAVETDTGRQHTRAELETPLTLPAIYAGVEVFALRRSAALFGHNAPLYGTLPKSGVFKADPFNESVAANNWDAGRTVWTDSKGALYSTQKGADVFLDHKVDGVVTGGWAVLAGTTLDREPKEEAYRVAGTTQTTLADYALSSDSTGLSLTLPMGEPLPPEAGQRTGFDMRRTTAWVVSEPLSLAPAPITALLPSLEEDGGSANLTLDREVAGLTPGQPVALTGEVLGLGSQAEVLLLQRVTAAGGFTSLQLDRPLAHKYVRGTVTLNANVVPATHGETIAEVLGSGDGTRTNQRFTLQRPPLTYLPAPVAGGVASTLEVRVDGVLWEEVPSLAAVDAARHGYMIEIQNGGTASIRFGDGVHGARLPSGTENVTAVYRSGIGLAGLVPAGSLILLAIRPLGIASVTNPLPASGAAPPETVERARADAPLAASTLGRIVSARDFEDFTRAFTGIAKVQAAPVGGLHLTMAGEGGGAVLSGSALYRNLVEALERERVPGPPVRVDSYQPLPFRLAAKLLVDPHFRPKRVFADAAAALAGAFSFETQELGGDLDASTVVAVLQSVPGVVAVDLDALYLQGNAPSLQSRLTARRARFENHRIQPAQLLVLDAAGVTLGSRTP